MINISAKSSLKYFLEVNQPIAFAHPMKQLIRLFWFKETIKEGTRFLAWWIKKAAMTGIGELERVGKFCFETGLLNWQGLVNYCKHPVTHTKSTLNGLAK